MESAYIRQAIDWQSARHRWENMLDRHEREKGQFLATLKSQGATQVQMAEQLGIAQQRVSQLLDYFGTMELTTTVVNPPTERELRAFIDVAADEIAEERGAQRVRGNREEVYERAGRMYEQAIEESPDNPQPPSKPHVAQSTGEFEWYSPPEIIEAARSVCGDFDLDPASCEMAQENVRAKAYYTEADDGLSLDWHGRIWMNPPYRVRLIDKFTNKLCDNIESGSVTEAFVLVNNATETAWFQDLAASSSAVCFPKGRLRFTHPEGKVSTPLQGQAILYFGEHTEAFVEAFGAFGTIYLGAWVRKD